jgi:hypothetical protein
MAFNGQVFRLKPISLLSEIHTNVFDIWNEAHSGEF